MIRSRHEYEHELTRASSLSFKSWTTVGMMGIMRNPQESRRDDWLTKGLRPTQHKIGHFRDQQDDISFS